jgi:hypothetical protein
VQAVDGLPVAGVQRLCNTVYKLRRVNACRRSEKPVKRRYIARKRKLKRNVNYNIAVFLLLIGQIQEIHGQWSNYIAKSKTAKNGIKTQINGIYQNQS